MNQASVMVPLGLVSLDTPRHPLSGQGKVGKDGGRYPIPRSSRPRSSLSLSLSLWHLALFAPFCAPPFSSAFFLRQHLPSRGGGCPFVAEPPPRVPPFASMTVMADLRSLLPGSRRLFFLLLHLACVFFFPAATSTNQPPPGRRRTPPSETSTAKSHEPSSVISYFRHVLFFYRPNRKQEQPPPTSLPLSPSSPLHKQLRHYLVYPERAESDEQNAISRPVGVAKDKATGSVKRPSFTSPADVFLCASCGEIFNRVNLLELHQATRHAFSELHDSDAGKNIVRIIFQSAWKRSVRGGEEAVAPAIHRILKIHHSPRTLARFEEYRDAVRSRATATRAGGGGGGDEERCAVDGNESLRFYCTTFLCRLGGDGNTATCGSPFCTACWIVRHGFSGKEAEGISMYATGSGAHASLPEELEREFAFMRVRRAMIVCRVVAGRVRPREAVAAELGEPAEDRGYDSVAARGTAEDGPGGVADELLVFNPRAVLPCFVVVYGV